MVLHYTARTLLDLSCIPVLRLHVAAETGQLLCRQLPLHDLRGSYIGLLGRHVVRTVSDFSTIIQWTAIGAWKALTMYVPLRLIDGAMPFSRLRQHLPWSYHNDPEKLAKLGREFPDEDAGKLDQALRNAKGNYIEAVRQIHVSHAQGNASTSPKPNNPRKLQKSAHRQFAKSDSDLVPNYAFVNHCQQPAPPFANMQFGQQAGHAPAQYSSAFEPLPPQLGYFSPQQQYAAPKDFHPGFSFPVPHMMPHWTNVSTQSSPLPPIPQQSVFPGRRVN